MLLLTSFFIEFIHSNIGGKRILIRWFKRDNLSTLLGSDWFKKKSLGLLGI
jgi:hypothetical protein